MKKLIIRKFTDKEVIERLSNSLREARMENQQLRETIQSTQRVMRTVGGKLVGTANKKV